MSLFKIENVTKTYGKNESRVDALKDINLTIHEGEILVIVGPSGSGKSTLLNVVSGLDSVTNGSIYYNDSEITKLKDKDLSLFRRENIGFIFQSYNLLPNLTVHENVLVGEKLTKEKVDVDRILKQVGIYEHKKKFPYQLSGGEQQRVSIARALAKKPDILFCDEPTGALDEEIGKRVLNVLQNINREFNTTLVIITHNPGIAAMANRIIKMNSGRIVELINNEKILNAWEISWV